MRECPHCGDAAMSVSDKLWRRRGSLRRCTSCGKRVVIPKVSIWALVLVIPPPVFLARAQPLLAIAVGVVLTTVLTWVDYKRRLVGR